MSLVHGIGNHALPAAGRVNYCRQVVPERTQNFLMAIGGKRWASEAGKGYSFTLDTKLMPGLSLLIKGPGYSAAHCMATCIGTFRLLTCSGSKRAGLLKHLLIK